MERKRRKGVELVGSSHIKERYQELLEAHKEFEKMLADGWQLTSVKKKRPRIKVKKERTPRKVVVSILGGTLKTTLTYTEWKEHGSIGIIIKEMY